jgi:hypothetical protein
MTEHAPDCGHNHDPNPYTDPARSGAYANVIRNLFRLGVINCQVDPRLTTVYAASTLVGLCDTTDRVPTARALLWELGSLVNIMTGGREPALETYTGDGDGDSGLMDPNDTPESAFGEVSMRAFFAAASVGDLQNAVNVVDAVRTEAAAMDIDPDAFMCQWFGNLVTSTAFTARAGSAGSPLRLFGE